jgi:hypothetical protein
MMLTAKDPAWRSATAGEVADQSRRLRDDLVSGAIGPRPVYADARLTITDAPVSQARGAVRSRTRTGRSHPQRTLGAAAVAALAALTCLVLLTVTGLASSSHPDAPPSSGPPATPSMAKSPSTASPLAAQPAGQQPSAPPNASTGAVAAVRHTPARHPPASQACPAARTAPAAGTAPAPDTAPVLATPLAPGTVRDTAQGTARLHSRPQQQRSCRLASGAGRSRNRRWRAVSSGWSRARQCCCACRAGPGNARTEADRPGARGQVRTSDFSEVSHD